MELSDLFYEYPDIQNENLQTIISSKKELKVLGDQNLDAISEPSRGNFYPQQKVIHRLLTHYDRLLITSEPGTGKTGMAAGFAEKLKRDHQEGIKSYVDEYISTSRSHFKKVYILLKNESLVDQWRQEIVCKYSRPDDYETEHIKNAPTRNAEKGRIKAEMNKYYIIDTYEKFAKEAYQLAGGEKRRKWGDMIWSSEYVNDVYSDSVFIIDEVHNLGSDDTELEDDRDEDKLDQKKKKDLKLKDKIYKALHFLFHNINRSKIILMSATPMINFSDEISTIMNLILPLDKQMPLDPSYYKVEASNSKKGITDKDINAKKEELKYYFKGYISYVSESKVAVVPKYMGENLNKVYSFHGADIRSKEVIYKVKMTKPPLTLNGKKFDGFNQVQSYNKISKVKKTKKSAFNSIERQAANMTFPDGTTGTSGASKYIEEELRKTLYNKNKKSITRYLPKNILRPWLSSKDTLRQLSAKNVETINLIEEADGNVFVFTPFRVGSGAYLLGMCLEYISGYQLFDRNTSIFYDEDSSGSIFNRNIERNRYCDTTVIKTKNKNIVIRKERPAASGIYKAGYVHSNGKVEPYKYAIITSNMTKELISNIISTYNSYENRHGEYIKCIIATPKARESINIFNVIRYINLGPGWNGKFMKQAKYRVFRSGSHKDLIYDKAMKYISMGQDPKDKDLRIIVEIYNMAAVKPSGEKTVDGEMYILSEKKDISISFIEKIMREDAVDCQIMSKINISSKKGTNETYVCSEKKPDTLRVDSYNNLYSSDIIEEIKIKIKSLFRRIFSIPIYKLHNSISEYNTFLIDMSLYELINQRDYIIDMYGYPQYFKETNNYIYITTDYPAEKDINKYILDYYTINRTFIYETSLLDYYNEVYNETKPNLYEDIGDFETMTFKEWSKVFFTLPDEYKLKQFEDVLSDALLHNKFNQANQNGKYRQFYNKFKMYIHFFYNPIDLLDLSQEGLSLIGTGKGAKPKGNADPELKNLRYMEGTKRRRVIDEMYIPPDSEESKYEMEKEYDVELGEMIYMHTFNQELIKGSPNTHKNARTSKFGIYEGNIRILKYDTWVNSDLNERLVYNAILNMKEHVLLEEFEEYDFVGIITIYPSEKNTLWIRMMTNETGKKRSKGKMATSYTIPELYYFMWYIYSNSKKSGPAILDFGTSSASLKENKYSKEIRAERIKAIENKKMSHENIEDYSDERINYYWILYQKGLTSTDIERLLKIGIIQFGNAYYV